MLHSCSATDLCRCDLAESKQQHMGLITVICTDTDEREPNKSLHKTFHPLYAK